jgi:thiol:disulfide interchange protein DsbD
MNLKKRSSLFCSFAAWLLVAGQLGAQPQVPHVVAAEPPQNLTVKRGATVEVPLKLDIRSGYHINSHTPSEEYLIPTNLNWEAGSIKPQGVEYPKGTSLRSEIAEKPLSVYSGTVTLKSKFTVSGDAPQGRGMLAGKVRYQACNERMCLPPRTLEVSVPVRVQ